MKDHLLRVQYEYLDGSTLGELKTCVEGFIAAYGEAAEYQPGHYGGEIRIEYWAPMTAEEKAEAKKRREAAAKAAKTRKEKKEKSDRAQYEKLKAKYG